ncbi:MAG: riboflavin synthase [Pseudomonadota bacterium]
MFTGIITDVGHVTRVDAMPTGKRYRISTAYDVEGIAMGASIACSGPCLTVVEKGANWFDVEASGETLDRTQIGSWDEGTRINLERSLTLGAEMGGHVVTGHVDGVATIVGIRNEDDFREFTIEVPAELAKFIAEKGSVSLDGTSLTVNTVEGNRFKIMLIPHTLEVTTWGERVEGDRLNVEVDLMARYAARLMEAS